MDPQGQPVSPEGIPPEVAVSPGAPVVSPQVPSINPGVSSLTAEQKQALLEMISQIRSRLGSFEATRFAVDAKTTGVRQALLRQVFEKLQLAGVDLTSRESVAIFIDRLRQENPELAGMFEQAMDALLGGELPQDTMNMNTYETVPKEV